MNKTIKNNLSEKANMEIKNKQYGILAGDLVDDKKMVDQENIENIITIGFLRKEKNLSVYNENFDIVLTEENANFEEIKNIIY